MNKVYHKKMDYTNADVLMKLSEEEIEKIYCSQYDEELNYPSIDKEREEGDIVYKIYIYGNHSKYLCRVFEDKDSDFFECEHTAEEEAFREGGKQMLEDIVSNNPELEKQILNNISNPLLQM